MFWFRRPPYLRWIAAAAVLVFGLLLDMRSVATVRYPFADTAIAEGTRIDARVRWREIPEGLLPTWFGPVGGISNTDLDEGDPLLPSLMAAAAVPADWWAVSLPLPTPVAPGTRIRVVFGNGNVIEGMVVDGSVDSGFGIAGTVAFAAADAPLVALALADDALTVMIAVDDGLATPTG